MTITHPSSPTLHIIVQVALGAQPMALVTLRSGHCVLQGGSAPIGPHQEESDTHSECWHLWPRDPAEMLRLCFYPHCLTASPPLPPPPKMKMVSSLLPCHFLSRNHSTVTGSTKKRAGLGPCQNLKPSASSGLMSKKTFPSLSLKYHCPILV